MATRAEIAGAIQQGMGAVEETFEDLSDEQLATQVYDDGDGWTAKQVLAHLAGRKAGYDMLIEMATGEREASFGDDMDFNAWNQRFVDERGNESRDELLTEFKTIHEELIEQAAALDDEQLAVTLTMPRGEMTIGDILAGSGGMHSINHSADVAKALGLDQDG